MAENQDNSRNEVEIDLDKYMAMIDKLDEQEDQIKEMKEEAQVIFSTYVPKQKVEGMIVLVDILPPSLLPSIFEVT